MTLGIVYAGQGPFDSEESLARWLEAQEELEAKRCLPPLTEKEKALALLLIKADARRSKRHETRFGEANRKLPKSFSSSATKQARLKGEYEGETWNL